ncbi:MAG: hypothetical protein HYV24_09385 [Deltaproteobacteria bacterium]|nr:hypothetical protein [Deltaproteobacteria bacterium]
MEIAQQLEEYKKHLKEFNRDLFAYFQIPLSVIIAKVIEIIILGQEIETKAIKYNADLAIRIDAPVIQFFSFSLKILIITFPLWALPLCYFQLAQYFNKTSDRARISQDFINIFLLVFIAVGILTYGSFVNSQKLGALSALLIGMYILFILIWNFLYVKILYRRTL